MSPIAPATQSTMGMTGDPALCVIPTTIARAASLNRKIAAHTPRHPRARRRRRIVIVWRGITLSRPTPHAPSVPLIIIVLEIYISSGAQPTRAPTPGPPAHPTAGVSMVTGEDASSSKMERGSSTRTVTLATFNTTMHAMNAGRVISVSTRRCCTVRPIQLHLPDRLLPMTVCV